MANSKIKLQRLKQKMQELDEDLQDSQNLGDMMTPYGDLMTLLLVFFVFFFILSDIEKMPRLPKNRHISIRFWTLMKP
jgi:flagellar motor protein MotB